MSDKASSKKKLPTMRDVAKEADVSLNAVSLAVNDKPGVGAGTRSRIFEVIDRLGYQPQSGSRALQGTKKGCVGIIQSAPPDVLPATNRFLNWLFGEMCRIFGARGERLCFDINPQADSSQGDYARCVWENLMSACVVLGPLNGNDTTLRRIHESGIPYLALGRLDSFPECSSAAVDYEEGAYMSTKFLLDRGHRSIAMLGGFTGYQPGIDRRRGYLRALEEAGIKPLDSLFQAGSFTVARNTSIVHRLMVPPEVTALVDASGLENAESLRDGARRAGKQLGKDVEAVVWTYSPAATVLSEAAAHLFLPVREVCSEGTEWLYDWYRGERVGPVSLVYNPVLYETMPDPAMTDLQRLFAGAE